MNGYLVLLNHTMDDLPIGLFETSEAAEAFAKRARPMPAKRIRDIFGSDCSTPCCVSIVQFRNGRPVSDCLAKSFN